MRQESDEEDLEQTIESLEIFDEKKFKRVLFPVNNNANAEKAGGSHWSLLVYDYE